MNAKSENQSEGQARYALVVAVLASAMGFIDGTIVAVALPQMREALDASFAESQWIANSYVLLLAALILIGGAAGDKFGTRRVFGWGIASFTFFSLLCALAWSAESLIAFRALQGAGAAIMIPGSMALIALSYPKERRGRALGVWVASSSITTSMGPMLGGFLLTYGGSDAWRWIFAINLPVGLLALILLRVKVMPDRPKEENVPLDFAGAALLALAMAGLAGGLTLLGEVEAPMFGVALLFAGLAIGALAVWWELRISHPMVDLRLFKSAAFSGVNVLTFLVWGAFGGVIFFLPMVLIVAWQLPPSYAGAIFVPFSLLIAILAPIAGRLTDRFGPRLLLTAGPLVCLLGHLALAWGVASGDYFWGILPAIVVLGCGVGLTASPVSTAAIAAVDDASAGAASGINNMFARMSALFSIAGLGAAVALAYAIIIRSSDLTTQVQEMMIEAGFAERLTGGLYQVATVELQAVAMDHAMIALCVVTAAMSLIGAMIGYLTQPGREALQ